MIYQAVKVGNVYHILKQVKGLRYWLMHKSRDRVYLCAARNAHAVADGMQVAGEEYVMLAGEYWQEEETVVQGGVGSPRFGGASANL